MGLRLSKWHKTLTRREKNSQASEIAKEGIVRHAGIPYRIRSANNEEFYSYLQRYLGFEEPDDRLLRLWEMASRQVTYPDVSPRTFSEFPLEAKENMINAAFGNGQSKLSCRFLNLVLAMEDVDRFSTISFEAWYRTWCPANNASSLSKEYSWLQELDLGPEQLRWLVTMDHIGTDWQRLNRGEIWAADTRAQFLEACLSTFEKSFHNLSKAELIQAKVEFDKLKQEWRSRLPGAFLPDLLLIVEGQTEALLLPYVLGILGVDMNTSGVLLTPVGGAKQAARRYLELRDLIEIPIVVILDNDATEESQLVRDMLREKDRLHVFSAGEIEDVFERGILIELVNRYLQNVKDIAPITVSDLDGAKKRTAILNRLWRERGLGDFDKVGFAQSIVDGGLRSEQIPAELKAIANLIKGAFALQ